jgi:hypothetical protein
MTVVVIHPLTLIVAQAFARKIDMIVIKHRNSIKKESIDTSTRNHNNKSRKCITSVDTEIIMRKTTDKTPLRNQEKKVL